MLKNNLNKASQLHKNEIIYSHCKCKSERGRERKYHKAEGLGRFGRVLINESEKMERVLNDPLHQLFHFSMFQNNLQSFL